MARKITSKQAGAKEICRPRNTQLQAEISHPGTNAKENIRAARRVKEKAG